MIERRDGQKPTTYHPDDAPAIHWKRTLYVMCVAQLITAVGFSSINPFLPLYIKTLGTVTNARVEILSGLAFSAQGLAMMIASPLWGTVADRHGRKLMVERAMFGGALTLLLAAWVRSGEELVLLRALQGLIAGTVSASNALVASVTPRSEKGYAMGVLQAGMSGGLALGPLMGGAIAEAFGYRAAFYVTAMLLVVSGVVVLIGVREEFVPEGHGQGRSHASSSNWLRLLAIPGVRVTLGMRFMSDIARTMITPIMPLFVQGLLSNGAHVAGFTGLVVGVGAAATTVGAMFLGRLADRVGHRRIVILCTLGAALFYTLQTSVTSGWHLLVLQVFVGLALGGVLPVISALLAVYTHSGEEGALYGLDMSVGSAARAVAPLAGAAVGVWFGLHSTFGATGLLYLVGGILAVWRLPMIHTEELPAERGMSTREMDV